MDLKRVNYSSGAPLEEKVGYSRVVAELAALAPPVKEI